MVLVMKNWIILCLCFGLSCSLRDETKMVVDVINTYERPTTVVAKVCWKLSEKRDLMTQLMTTDKAVAISFISDQKEINKFDPKDTAIVIDLNCQATDRFLHQADDNNMFGKPYRWLVLANDNDFAEIPTELTNLKVLVDSEVIVVEKTKNDTFKLKLVYRIDPISGFLKEEFGSWTTTDGFKLSETVAQTTMANRRKNLHGKAIATSYVITDNSSRTDIYLQRNLNVDSLTKVTHCNILPLYYFMNATLVMLYTDTWGYYINNSWNGMIGDIVNGRAEFSGTLSFINIERVPVVQYMTQPVPIGATFLFREPALSFQNNLFILPFSGAVWMCIGGLVVVLILVIYLNAKWEAVNDEEAIMNDSTPLKPNLSDIGIYVISAITQQGSTNELKGSLGRVVTFLTFVIFLFLYTSYSANIVALLQSSSSQIRTLTDLLNSKFELGVEDEKYNRYYFAEATDPVRKAIYENKIVKVGYKPNFMDLEEGVRRLQNKDAPFAFHMNTGVGYKMIEKLFLEHEKCGLHEIAYYQNVLPWIYARKFSPYSEIYKIGLSRIMEHGIASRVYNDFYSRKPLCATGGGSFASVNMVDFHPVLLWMLYGVILSVFLLMVEILMYRRQHGGIETPTS